MSLGHGIANEILTDPDWDAAPAIALGEQPALRVARAAGEAPDDA
jgi:hypothetical protein